MIFLPKFPTEVLFVSVPDREILKVNFVVPGMIPLRSGKWTVSNSLGPIVEGLLVFMICCHMPLRANPFL